MHDQIQFRKINLSLKENNVCKIAESDARYDRWKMAVERAMNWQTGDSVSREY